MKICPFISHLLGDGGSGTLSIDTRTTDGLGSAATEDVVVLGYDSDDGNSSVRTQVLAEKAVKGVAEPLYCLRESCRFYQKASNECQFDSIYAALRESGSDEDGRDIRQVTRDIDKIWKFQTQGVAEIVESLADLEKKQTQAFGQLEKELIEKLEGTAGGTTESLFQPIRAELETLGRKVDGSGEGLEGLSTTVSDFVTSLEDNLKELKSLSDQLTRDVTEIKGSLPREDWISASLRGPLDAAIEAQRELEKNLISWKDEVVERVTAVASRQEDWEKRLEEIVERQKELATYLEEGRQSRAEDRTRKTKKESKKYNTLGVTSFHNGAFELARDQFLQAVKLDPEFSEAYNNLGLAYTELGDEEKATESFTKAVELNPSLHAAYNNLGYAFYRQGNYEQAVEMYNEALGRSASNSTAYTNLGNAYYRLGRIDKAREAWNKALELDPTNERAKKNLNRIDENAK
jgi:Flp pilus assembly protein TadD